MEGEAAIILLRCTGNQRVRRKSIRKDRYIGGTASARVRDRAVKNGGSKGSVYDERGILSF